LKVDEVVFLQAVRRVCNSAHKVLSVLESEPTMPIVGPVLFCSVSGEINRMMLIRRLYATESFIFSQVLLSSVQ